MAERHHARGYWLEEAGPVDPAPPLAGDRSVDVVIVGGGYTGLWTAWHLKRLEPLWLALVIIGALNWLLVGLFDTNVVAEIFGTGTLTDVVYVIVGFAGLMMLPRLFEAR